jgi:hypothetical protein
MKYHYLSFGPKSFEIRVIEVIGATHIRELSGG